MTETSNESSRPMSGSSKDKLWRYGRYVFLALALLIGSGKYAELLGENASLEYQRHVYMTAACKDRTYLKHVLDEVVQPDDHLLRLGLWQEAKTNMLRFCDDLPAAPAITSGNVGEVASTAGQGIRLSGGDR